VVTLYIHIYRYIYIYIYIYKLPQQRLVLFRA